MTVTTETDLQNLAERGALELDGASAIEMLRWTDENFGGKYVVASNMQDAVLIDLAVKQKPDIDLQSSTQLEADFVLAPRQHVLDAGKFQDGVDDFVALCFT